MKLQLQLTPVLKSFSLFQKQITEVMYYAAISHFFQLENRVEMLAFEVKCKTSGSYFYRKLIVLTFVN